MCRMDAPVRAVHAVLTACRSGQPLVTLRTGGRGAIGPWIDSRYEIRVASHPWELVPVIHLYREPVVSQRRQAELAVLAHAGGDREAHAQVVALNATRGISLAGNSALLVTTNTGAKHLFGYAVFTIHCLPLASRRPMGLPDGPG